jgi:hypothetical protein
VTDHACPASRNDCWHVAGVSHEVFKSRCGLSIMNAILQELLHSVVFCRLRVANDRETNCTMIWRPFVSRPHVRLARPRMRSRCRDAAATCGVPECSKFITMIALLENRLKSLVAASDCGAIDCDSSSISCPAYGAISTYHLNWVRRTGNSGCVVGRHRRNQFLANGATSAGCCSRLNAACENHFLRTCPCLASGTASSPT